METLSLDVTKHIKNFRDFLNVSWSSIDNLMDEHDWDDDGLFIGDWLQANWELLVERELLGNNKYALTQFSITHLSKRIIEPNKICTHTILAIGENLVDLRSEK